MMKQDTITTQVSMLVKHAEEREAKKQKTFIGNGKVVWNNGNIVNAEREEQAQKVPQSKEVADLPF